MNYEEKVSTRADVKALFERVSRDGTVEKYRGYTETKSYGWDADAEDYIKCDGEVWFDNPAYVPEECAACSADAELLDEKLAASEVEIARLQDERAELCRVIDELNARLTAAETQSEALSDECDSANDTLLELRDAFAVIRRWILGDI